MTEHDALRLPLVTRVAVVVLAAAILVLACFMVWSGVEGARERDTATRQVQAAAQRADVLIANLRTQEADAATERQQLLATQADLLVKYSRLEASQRHLLRWLRMHGIKVPTRYVVTPRVVRATRGTDAPRPKQGRSIARPRQPSAQPPTPTLPNGKPAPGNSGNAPGHQKH